MPFAEVRDVRLFYTDDGPRDADVLLLVHGMGADSHDWVWHLPDLAGDFRVIAPDLRGHGYSSVPDKGNVPREMAEDLAALLGRLGVARVVAVGHSLGGQVVSVLAVEHPELVRGVVAVDPGYGLREDIAAFMSGYADGLRTNAHETALAMDSTLYTPASPPSIKAWHERKLLGTAPHVLAEVFAALFVADGQFGVRPQSAAYLAGRTQPVLSLWADPERAAWERDALGAETHVFPGNGHRLHEERPAEFLHVLRTWLAQLTRRERRAAKADKT
ncbi:pimeloyl-ACP methyl ester carboxylesterase [Actinocorallia herbida]|uniref:Pimeloyl-ACP methyl ester carboxylesterase n=1 Tax=Actinocorallia herbida TaxID=58109 RepID=A0A3N1CQ90_9ACTN|nr:alpha/beta fold hydrolase [Actinocorallia herbida]ROO83480.1 pimeloyl-ACP methyl ester carboxylesterase [Actinocorallia herbida]